MTHQALTWLTNTMKTINIVTTIADPSQWFSGFIDYVVIGDNEEWRYKYGVICGFILLWPLIGMITWFILTDEERKNNYILQCFSAAIVVAILVVRGTISSLLAWSMFVPLLFFILFLLAIGIVKTGRRFIKSQHYLIDASLQTLPLVFYLLVLLSII